MLIMLVMDGVTRPELILSSTESVGIIEAKGDSRLERGNHARYGLAAI